MIMCRRSSFLVLLFLLVCGPQVALAFTIPGLETISAGSALIMDAETGEILWGRDIHRPRPPASDTKIMTALLVVEYGHLQEPVTVDDLPVLDEDASVMGLMKGQQITVTHLLAGLLLSSGCDAAVVLARHIAGSESDFVVLMNRRAQELGAVDTHFVNVHGLPAPGHVTSAYDLALMSRYGLADPLFATLVASPGMKISWLGGEKYLWNTNRLLREFDGADGVKSGTSDEAGECLVASATRQGRRLLVVLMGSNDRWAEAAYLLDAGFRYYDQRVWGRRGEKVGTVAVQGGQRTKVDAVLAQNCVMTVLRDDSHVYASEFAAPDWLQAPVLEGQRIGTWLLYADGQKIREIPAVAAHSVAVGLTN